MKVNQKKTQLLCIHADHASTITSYVKTGEDSEIISGTSLKILGFNFDNKPDATFHVSGVIEKFYNRLWTLRFLRKSGMKTEGMLKAYKSILRPFVEYCSVVYHSLIPKYLSDRLEAVQKLAVRIIFGETKDYRSVIDEGILETLASRRETKCCLLYTSDAADE